MEAEFTGCKHAKTDKTIERLSMDVSKKTGIRAETDIRFFALAGKRTWREGHEQIDMIECTNRSDWFEIGARKSRQIGQSV
jgi:hypothetical protein